ncbi:carboxymuconolactone decarboxylase family protein [Mesosutterella sp. OilRF-GAM-744-9]|uniref:Carboxymuconolactone decarboxylase family protein n=1 Tax=Mesosutterella porci TaxID=2915351 RepID=A0ABS9MQR2_9BURK|nr:carboxymuconolactone decarboxylase family protein [Mesosutterella sp. oilRF-744-WT-GAM-9]MCG5030872.1 carboxymuconolactone decarboxylase family protein [Mesosutterella sp. oilRF-744-WT-GAM-9]MCI6530874.1 carboxymuconolactone decarboxylase family protein [Mesosutterella sp.]
MTSFSRRSVLMAAAAAGLTGEASASAPQGAGPDPELDAIRRRLLTLKSRGPSLSTDQKYCVLLAVVTAGGTPGEAELLTRLALRDGVSPEVIHESIFQTSPYSGLARADAALRAAALALRASGRSFPQGLSTTDDSNRFSKGLEVQKKIFGAAIDKMHQSAADAERALIVDDLTGWCFGDYYTRKGLAIRERELVTFAAIAALGGCEPQLTAHAGACLRSGLTRQNLIDALQVGAPYLGFPRTLNALAIVKKA